MKTLKTEVLIVGAGPAGLSLAMELGVRGIACVLVDPQVEVNAHPRASLLGQRSIELFRRHGLANTFLRSGLPTHLPYEIRFVTELTGRQLYMWSVPSYDELEEMHRGLRPSTPSSRISPYTRVQIGQHTIEPILRRRVAEFHDVVSCYYGWELQDFSQTEDGVTGNVVSAGSGERMQVQARYLAACDGARSPVRRVLDIQHSGRGAIGRNRSFLIRAPMLIDQPGFRRANLHFVYKKGVYGVLTDLDGKGLYSYSHFAAGALGADDDARDVLRAAVGRDFQFDLLSTMEWYRHQSVADRLQSGRVFLLGDAAHRFCPSGGIGMNTAIGDAFDLAWKLDARIRGWGGDGLLKSYEDERWPIAVRNTIYAADNRDRLDATLSSLPAELGDANAAGEAARQFACERFRWLAQQFGSAGAHLGLRYRDSPIVVPDGTPEPPDDTRVVVQSTWPGCRAPHAFIDDGRSTLDLFDGSAFVLLRCASTNEKPGALTRAAQHAGVPLQQEHLEGEAARLYERTWVLVRPDGHVAWRGDALPDDPPALLRTVTGR